MTNRYAVGDLTSKKEIETAMADIRGWLALLDINRYDIKLDYDPRINIAIAHIKYKGKEYEFQSTKQRDCRLNMHAIARAMEYKVRLSKLGIEDFSMSMSPYLALPGSTSDMDKRAAPSYDSKQYAVLGLPHTASNEELAKQYKMLVNLYHPDRVSGDDAKQIANAKMYELNEAWQKIKLERGLT